MDEFIAIIFVIVIKYRLGCKEHNWRPNNKLCKTFTIVYMSHNKHQKLLTGEKYPTSSLLNFPNITNITIHYH